MKDFEILNGFKIEFDIILYWKEYYYKKLLYFTFIYFHISIRKDKRVGAKRWRQFEVSNTEQLNFVLGIFTTAIFLTSKDLPFSSFIPP